MYRNANVFSSSFQMCLADIQVLDVRSIAKVMQLNKREGPDNHRVQDQHLQELRVGPR